MHKTIKSSEWASWPIVSAATATQPVIRKDNAGKQWAWVASGKRVTIKPAK